MAIEKLNYVFTNKTNPPSQNQRKLNKDTFQGMSNKIDEIIDEKFDSVEISNTSKSIYTTDSTGFNIEINKMVNDKMPILVVGCDNSNGPTLIVINARMTGTTVSFSSIAGNRTVTRNGATYHVNASAYSTYWVITPLGGRITLTNGALSS